MRSMMRHFLKRIPLEKKLVWSSGAVLVVLFGLYGYFVNATVLNVVQRRDIENAYEQVNGKISQLEFEYISLSSELDMEQAQKLGLRRVDNPEYAKRVEDQAFTLAR